MLGSVVGTGNIWRFPRIVANNATEGGKEEVCIVEKYIIVNIASKYTGLSKTLLSLTDALKLLENLVNTRFSNYYCTEISMAS